MDRDDILAFQAVAEHRSFTKAAETLSTAQPTLSKKMAHLEQEIGVTLLERTKRSVKLTSAGLLFLQGSKALLEQEAALLDNVRKAGCSTSPLLQLAIMGTGLSQQFLPIIRRFRRDNPAISLELSLMDFRQLQDKLQAGKIDCAIAGDPGLTFLSPLKTALLCPAYHCLVLPRDHPWAKKTVKNWKAFAQEPFIILTKQISARRYEKVFEICASWGFQPCAVRYCETVEEILFQVQAGLGITILPDFDLPPEGQLPLMYVPIKRAAAPFSTVLAWNSRQSNPSGAILRDYLLEHSKNS